MATYASRYSILGIREGVTHAAGFSILMRKAYAQGKTDGG